MQPLSLCLFNKFLTALGAFDRDFPLTSGYTHQLAALRAVILPVLAILNSLQKQQKLSVFLIPLIGISGKCSADCPNHQAVGESRQTQIQPPNRQNHGQQAGHDTCAQNKHIQFICAVATGHKMPKPVADSSHHQSPFSLDTNIILKKTGISTAGGECSRIV